MWRVFGVNCQGLSDVLAGSSRSSRSLTAQYRDKEKASGPYYQLSYAHEKKNHTNYIRADCVTEVRQQIENYKRFKKLTTEWVALGIEHSKLSMQMKLEGAGKSD